MSWLLTSSALACGGLFCSSVQFPVDQSREGVVFAIDGETSSIEMHAQIGYTGPAEQFAWFIPAPAPPTLSISTEALFSGLDLLTRPRFTLSDEDSPPVDTDFAEADSDDSDGGGVTLVAAREVGPYDTVTLTAESVEALTAWLVDNDYYVPDGASDALAVYVAEGSYIVALRLQKDRDVGDLAPIALTWDGTDPTIPLRLTALAAVPDMPVTVWVLGAHRAIPLNYLHVVINPFAIDWWQWDGNYADVVRRAADEAGGQAFATDATADPSVVRTQVGPPVLYDRAAIASAPHLRAVWLELWTQRFVVSTRLVTLMERELPGATEVFDAIQSGTINLLAPACESPEDLGCAPIDAGAAAAALDEEIVAPMRRARSLVTSHAVVTRLTSSISPAEMTLDPTFALNPDLPPVDATRTATLEGGVDGDGWRLFRVDGFDALPIPDDVVLWEQGLTAFDYLQSLAPQAALRIEQMGRSGDPVVIVDEAPTVRDAIAALRVDAGLSASEGEAARACGCAGGPERPGIAALLVAVVWSRRRRPSAGRASPPRRARSSPHWPILTPPRA